MAHQELLSSIFRAIHTIKGVSGSLGFSTLGAVTHRAESTLSQLRGTAIAMRDAVGEIANHLAGTLKCLIPA